MQSKPGSPDSNLRPADPSKSSASEAGANTPDIPRLAQTTPDLRHRDDQREPSTIPHPTSEQPDEKYPECIGRYRIRRLLGRGGMGAVYLAHDPELDRPVALKVPQLSGASAEDRFLREARAAAAVSHPNLCPVYDAGRADGVLYLAMAYIPGATLTEVLRDQGPLPPAQAAALASAVARGMAEAHRHGIVHRDLKPGNILLDRQGNPVVTDFGLALRNRPAEGSATPTRIASADERITQVGMVVGTPAYMPPEQARGALDQVGPASDVYALGAILYELLTGSRPFRADTMAALIARIEHEPASAPSALQPGIPAGLDAICLRALAKNPAERFPSMEAFAEALAPHAGGAKRGRGKMLVAVATLVGFLVLGGVVLYLRTDYGTVEVRFNDPSAKVEVQFDGKEIKLAENGQSTRLRAGPHALEVKGPGFETETRVFKVTRGETTVVEVELKQKVAPDPKANRARLAELLTQGEALIRKARYSELRPVADEALRIDPDSPTALAFRASCQAMAGNKSEARTDAQAALKLNPETAQALLVLAFLQTVEGNPDEAIALENMVIRLDPNNPWGWTNRGWAYLNRMDYHQAITDSTQGINLGNSLALLNRGGAYACLGKYREALEDYNKAAALAPNNAQIFLQRSVVYAKAGMKTEAEADWAKAQALDRTLRPEDRPVIPDPPQPPARKTLAAKEAETVTLAIKDAETFLGANRLPEARKRIEEACRLAPTFAEVHSLHARILAESGVLPLALAEAELAMRLNPNDAWAYAVRGGIKRREKDLAGAIADQTIALRLDPSNAVTWNNRGYLYYLRGNYHQALADFTEAIRLRPDLTVAYPNRGGCYLRFADYQKALDDYHKIAEAEPSNPRWPMICAAIRTKLNDPEGAKQERAAALKIDPKAADAPALTLPAPLPPPKKDPAAARADAGWNDELKSTLETLFPSGVAKGVGRHLYGELDTALETLKDGEWRVGAGMTKDHNPVVLKVTQGKLFVAHPTAEQVTAWKLLPRTIDRKVEARFQHRHLDLVRLTAKGPVKFVRLPEGDIEITLRFNAEVVTEQPIESVNLILLTVVRTADGKEGTTEIYHQPRWIRPPHGEQEIRFRIGPRMPALLPGYTARLSIDAFVLSPRPGRYRISNELSVELRLP